MSLSRAGDVPGRSIEEISVKWSIITELPFDDWERSIDACNIDQYAQMAANMVWNVEDEHFTSRQHFIAVMRLLRMVAKKYIERKDRFNQEGKPLHFLKPTCQEGDELPVRASQLRNEGDRTKSVSGHNEYQVGEGLVYSPRPLDLFGGHEASYIKENYEKCRREMERLRLDNEQLQRAARLCDSERTTILRENEKCRLECKHLLAKHKRFVEKHERLKEMLREAYHSEKSMHRDEESELQRLRQKVRALEIENHKLRQSRDQAEEAREQREAEALRDMTELQKLHHSIVDEERRRAQKLNDELRRIQQSADNRVEEAVKEFQQKLGRLSGETVELPRSSDGLKLDRDHPAENPGGGGATDYYTKPISTSSKSAEDKVSRPKIGMGGQSFREPAEELRRLEQENEQLNAELQQMKLRLEACEAENVKVNRLLREYEHGDEGLRNLRGQLTDSTRSVELLQDENSQLREQLNAMKDSVSFSEALEELCVRVGVSREEVDRLRPTSSLMFNDMDVLRAENTALKEELQWLERERQHWLDKVRLQPLLDTKLRRGLDLSPDQLKKLDKITEQMKADKIIIEEVADENYKEKYYNELQLRRKEMEHFNSFVKQLIEEALREVLGKIDISSSAEATSALHLLRDRVDLIATRQVKDKDEEGVVDILRLQEQLRSTLQLLEQSELTIKDNAVSQIALREQLAAVTAERDVLMDERDRYRSAVFDGLGAFESVPAEVKAQDAEGDGGNCAVVPLAAASSKDSLPPDFFIEYRNGTVPLHSVSVSSLKSIFEKQLRTKDELIASLRNTIETINCQLVQRCNNEAEMKEKLAEASSRHEDLQNQVSAMQEINEDLTAKLNERTKILGDLEGVVHHANHSNTRELLQKIIILRQRETKLLQRLRRVTEMHKDASISERNLREYVNTTFKSLKEALENTSTGFVLPRSSCGVEAENAILDEMQQRLGGLLRGRMFKEDSNYLVSLQRVYGNMGRIEEFNALRLEVRNQRNRIAEMEGEFESQRAELEHLRKQRDVVAAGAMNDSCTAACGGDSSSAIRWEAEAKAWRQKCDLYMKRCEAKEQEISTLEGQLDDARKELVLLHEHASISGGKAVDSKDCGALMPDISQERCEDGEREQSQSRQDAEPEPGGHLEGKLFKGSKTYRLEREIARLKSINLGVLHYSLDLQGECKRLEIELEAAREELSLIRDASGDSSKVSEFVSAAIRQHSVLRRQGELALFQAKRARMQLCATEANLRVAINEANAYKLNTFRLYRQYVAQTVLVVDYVRGMQRSGVSALSPHRAEILHKRLMDTIADNDRSHSVRAELSAQLAESQGTVALLQQQLELLQVKDDEARADALHAKLLTSLAAVREKDIKIVELMEDHGHLQHKLKRTESYVQQLTEELNRLELNAFSVKLVDKDVVNSLLELKESVFAKAEPPAIVIQQDCVTRRRSSDLDDIAVQEYKHAIEKQVTLAQECDCLRKQLGDETAKSRKTSAINDKLKEEVEQLCERLRQVQQQLHDERQRAEEREKRVIRSHEVQAQVAHRAAEHNSKCLQDMLRNKEACIKQLQEQLQAERRKYLECQMEESVRMEKVHERLFKENNSMVERFREAINGVAEHYEFTNHSSTGGPPSDGASAQLALLTKEVLHLKAELKNARATNITLESRLNEQIRKIRQHDISCVTQPAEEASYCHQQKDHKSSVSEGSTVTGIISDQSAIIDSLRQRELSLISELQRTISERDVLAQQLREAQSLVVDQGSVLKTVVTSGTIEPRGSEAELRAQQSFLEAQLMETRAKLEEERQQAHRLQMDTTHWRQQLDSLREEVLKQQCDVERARRLVAMNEKLSADVQHMEEQNQKLILATNLLKQRLVEEAQERDNTSRKHQHEMALAQRMGNIQQESSEHIKNVNLRLQTIQQELEEKVHREEEALKKHEEAQRLSLELHLQLQEKERELLKLKREMATLSSKVSPQQRRTPRKTFNGHEKSTQVLQTVQEEGEDTRTAQRQVMKHQGARQQAINLPEKGGGVSSRSPKSQGNLRPHSALSQLSTRDAAIAEGSDGFTRSQVAAMVLREVEKAQRDNLHRISSLQAVVSRQARDLEDAAEQLRGERDVNRSLRIQLQNIKKELETKELSVAQEVASYYRANRDKEKKPWSHSNAEMRTPTPDSASPPSLLEPQAFDVSLFQQVEKQCQENEELRHRIEKLTKRQESLDKGAQEADFYKRELEELRKKLMEAPDPGHNVSSFEIRTHKRTVMKLESVIESLRRELIVGKEAELRLLRQQMDDLRSENERLSAELNRYQVIPTAPVVNTSVPEDMEPGMKTRLERELLDKNGVILDLRFEREALQLKVSRLECHIEHILKVDSMIARSSSASKQRDRVEALETLVENMKLVIERLQNENEALKSKSVSMSKHMDLVRELRELRSREQDLREHSEKLSLRLLTSSTGCSAMSEQQARLQRKLQVAQATVEQYRAEVVELRQRVSDMSKEQDGALPVWRAPQQGGGGSETADEDLRDVYPLNLPNDGLPPPLPDAPRY
uniref:Uncharacterized protein n=1 Tax=Trypanosoma congolense (strain IL3000) TaxID=1068625 RepID=G0UW20_TRYCI|nr:conserved hypothetical protein [Trypanosoma congolense IL3000]